MANILKQTWSKSIFLNMFQSEQNNDLVIWSLQDCCQSRNGRCSDFNMMSSSNNCTKSKKCDEISSCMSKKFLNHLLDCYPTQDGRSNNFNMLSSRNNCSKLNKFDEISSCMSKKNLEYLLFWICSSSELPDQTKIMIWWYGTFKIVVNLKTDEGTQQF